MLMPVDADMAATYSSRGKGRAMSATMSKTGRPGVPVATPETLPYWEGIERGELLAQYFPATGSWFLPPRPFDPADLSVNSEWRAVSGRGRLESFIINSRPVAPVADIGTQIIALVTLEEGPRIVSNLVGVEPVPEAIELGIAVHVQFVELGGIMLPVFAPVKGESA